MCTCHILFSHSFVDGCLDCFHLLAIVSNAVTNISVPISVQVPAFIALGHTPRGEIAGLYGSAMASLLGSYQSVCHNSCNILPSHQQCLRFPISPPTQQHLPSIVSFLFYKTIAILGVKCYFIVLLILSPQWIMMLAYFHDFIGHLCIFFGEMSVQVLCLFFEVSSLLCCCWVLGTLLIFQL